jgi:hypothetical protein
MGGAITPKNYWRLYAENAVAPLRRKSGGAITPKTKWRLYAGNSQGWTGGTGGNPRGGERGHEVVVLEATNHPGGQIRLTAQNVRRKEMIGIVDWRMSECERLGVKFKFNTWAESATVQAEDPDVVIVATGGMPHTDVLREGNEWVVSTWDIISGDVKPGSNVLIFDDAGDHAALQAAEVIAQAGGKVEIMTPDRSF